MSLTYSLNKWTGVLDNTDSTPSVDGAVEPVSLVKVFVTVDIAVSAIFLAYC